MRALKMWLSRPRIHPILAKEARGDSTPQQMVPRLQRLSFGYNIPVTRHSGIFSPYILPFQDKIFAMADTNASAEQVLTIGVEDISNYHQTAFISSYVCGGRTFEILVTDDPPPGYDRDSTEVGWTDQLFEISLHDNTDPDKIQAHDCFLIDLCEDIKEIVRPKLLELAPPALGSPPPEDPLKGGHTVQEHLYPDVVKLHLVSRVGSFDLIQGLQS